MKKLLAAFLLLLPAAAWAAPVSPFSGGTGIANANANTITLGGPFVTTGANTVSPWTVTGTTTLGFIVNMVGPVSMLNGGIFKNLSTGNVFFEFFSPTQNVLHPPTGGSLVVNNQANSVNLFSISDTGVITIPGTLNVIGAVTISTGGGASTAACWKADGITLGKCTSVVGAGGGCTCP